MILGIGVDLLSLPRFAKLVARRGHTRLSNKILHPVELAQFHSLRHEEREGYLALRWAAKEATYKALYPAFKLRWKEILVRKEGEKPTLTLELARVSTTRNHGEKFHPNKTKIHLSISHDAELLVAYVVAEHR